MNVGAIVLIGLPGVGKSTVARALGDRWGVPALDSDDLITAAVDEPAADYLRSRGEAAFREVEAAVVDGALSLPVVLATGAGVVSTDAGRSVLRGASVVWLDAPNDVLVDRVADGDRPLLATDPASALARLRAERAPWYEALASVRVDASRPVEDIVDDVVAFVGAPT